MQAVKSAIDAHAFEAAQASVSVGSKRKRSGGKKSNPYDPNKSTVYTRMHSKGLISAYRNLMKQYHVNIKTKLEPMLGKSVMHPDFDIRDFTIAQFEKPGVVEAFATGARMLEKRRAMHNIPARNKGDLLRYDGYISLWKKYLIIWKNAIPGRGCLSKTDLERRVHDALFAIGESEVIQTPVMPPSKSEMQQIFAHLEKNDSILNLQRKLLIYLCTFFESRTGANSLQNIAFNSLRFIPEQGILMYRERNSKTCKKKMKRVRIVGGGDKKFLFAFNVYFKLREISLLSIKPKDQAEALLLRIRSGCEYQDVGATLKLNKGCFENKPLTSEFVRKWFHDLCVEAGLPNCDRFRGKSVRQFLAAIESENGVCTWKNKAMLDTYDQMRVKLNTGLSTSLCS